MKVRVSFPERCKGCGLCVDFCRRKVLEVGRERNRQGYRVVRVVDERKCNGCGVCYLMCPDVVLEVF